MTATKAFSSILLFAVLLLQSLPHSTDAGTPSMGVSTIDFIRSTCYQTRYPDVCYATLGAHAKAFKYNDMEKLSRTALYVTRGYAEATKTTISDLRVGKSGDVNGAEAEALDDCALNFEGALGRIRVSMKQMRKLKTNKSNTQDTFAFEMGNIQSWMSAVLTDEDTCVSSFEGVNDGPVKTAVSERAEIAKKTVSNALALLNLYINSKN